jgi:hypothetical protein
LNTKESELGKGGSKCCKRNKKRRSARKSKRRSGEGWRRWNARRWRNVKLIGRGSERGHIVQKEAGPDAIRKGKYPGALSKAPPCDPGILHSLRHVRCSSNTRLPCCTCHCTLLFKFTA